MTTFSLRETVSLFTDRKLLSIFLLGICSGFPWVMIGSGLSAWLSEQGLTRSMIGLIGFVYVAYSVNFLWAPLIDTYKVSILSKHLGRRKAWIFIFQLCIAIACILLAYASSQQNLLFIGITALSIAISSASQDITIDAYRIDLISNNEQSKISAGAAMATSGWWTGFAGLGSIPFFLADFPGWDWDKVYLVLAAIMIVFACLTLFLPNPQEQHVTPKATYPNIYYQLAQAFWMPLKDFFSRYGITFALQLLAFIFLFKIGEAFLGRMSVVFYKEIGFSNTDIAIYSKLINWWITILFSLLGGIATVKLGMFKGLLIGGIAMALSNLSFAYLATQGPDTTLLTIAVVIDGFTSSWSSVAFVAFLSMLCNKQFTATQYALLASLGTTSRTLMASFSGVVVDYLNGNWALFFIITALMIIPSLVLLLTMKHKLAEFSAQKH